MIVRKSAPSRLFSFLTSTRTPLLLLLCGIVLSAGAHAQLIVGANNPGCQHATVQIAAPTVRVGGTVRFATTSDSGPITTGLWNVPGGWGQGNIEQNGTFHAPNQLPANNVTVVNYYFASNNCILTSAVTILNATPVINYTWPAKIDQLHTPITVLGDHFLPTSVLSVNGVPVRTTYIDHDRLVSSVDLTRTVSGPITISVTNPDPGSSSATIALPTTFTSSDPVCSNASVHVSQPSVRIGSSVQFTTTSDSGPVSGGIWYDIGGLAQGNIEQSGAFHAPNQMPANNVTTVGYSFNGAACNPTTTVTLLNATPIINYTWPSKIDQLHTPLTVLGDHFLPTSVLSVNGRPVPSTYVDHDRIVSAVDLTRAVSGPVTITVTNPDPGSSSATFSLPATFASSDPACGNAAVHVSQSSVRIGDSVQFTTTSDNGPVTGGIWYAVGGLMQGNVEQSGAFHTPNQLPANNITTVGYTFNGNSCMPTTTVTLLNATPKVYSVAPTSVTQLSTPLTIIGENFLPTTVISINGKAVPTTFIGHDRLTATINFDQPVSGTVSITVTNPDPGSSSAGSSIPATFPDLGAITPSTLALGNNTITIKGTGFTWQSSVTFDGHPLAFNLASDKMLTANVYIAPWRTGTVPISVQPIAGGPSSASTTLSIQALAVSFDVASRFSTQAALGPRLDVVQRIQSIGLKPFITEQLQQPAPTYRPSTTTGRGQFLQAATGGNSLLRLRVALALESIIVNQASNYDFGSFVPWERMMEADALGNYRTLLTDVASDARMGAFLNLAGNNATTDPNLHPNQNFARELIQLFSLGPTLLNEDGSLKTDSSGRPQSTYDQTTVLDVARALTGWQQAPFVDPNYTFDGIDASQPLVANNALHDHGSKTLFSSVNLPAGQDIVTDRTQTLDAIFNHPNLPPFVSRQLIQHLVKSNPSPAYIQRISTVFKDNGQHVRGDLAAVVTAILLDPEARAGDTRPDPTDGFLEDPILFEIFTVNTLGQSVNDSQPGYMTALIDEPLWYPPSVNGFYSNSHLIPATSIVSPEFALWNNLTLVNRGQLLYGMINGSVNGFGDDYMNYSWLYRSFTNVPDLVEALNHLIYHGTMPDSVRSTILSTCAGLNPNDKRAQFVSAIFLAMNSDSNNVQH